MKHNLKLIAAFALVAVTAQGCATYEPTPTAAETRLEALLEASDQGKAELEQCGNNVKEQYPSLSLEGVIWNGISTEVPINYLMNKQQLDDTQKAEFTARTDATNICNARNSDQRAAIHALLGLASNIFIHEATLTKIALLEDRITVGQYHEEMKQHAAVNEEAQTTASHHLYDELVIWNLAELAQELLPYGQAVTPALSAMNENGENFQKAFAENQQCFEDAEAQNPTTSLDNVIWDEDVNTMPIRYLMNKQVLDKTQKAELVARTDASLICFVRIGVQLGAIRAQLKSIVDLFNDKVTQTTIALLEDRINVGQYHQAYWAAFIAYSKALNADVKDANTALMREYELELIARAEAHDRVLEQRAANARARRRAYDDYDYGSTGTMPPPSNRTRIKGYLQDNEVSGRNRICYYNAMGSTRVVTIPAERLCPLTNWF